MGRGPRLLWGQVRTSLALLASGLSCFPNRQKPYRTDTQMNFTQSLTRRDSCLASPVSGRLARRSNERWPPSNAERTPGRHPHSRRDTRINGWRAPCLDGSHGSTMKCDRHRMPIGSHRGAMKSDCHRRPNGHPGDIPTITEAQGFMFGKPRARTVRMEALCKMIVTKDRTGTQATSPQSLRHKDSCLASPVPGRFTRRHHEM